MTLSISGAGTGSSTSLTGVDEAGIFSVTTGTGGGGAITVMLNYAITRYGTQSRVKFFPLNANASTLALPTTATEDGCQFEFGASDATLYAWAYSVD